MSRLVIACLFVLGAMSPSLATSGPGCLVVVNVASNDALNLRANASALSGVVDRLVPGQHGIIHLDGKCIPESRPWGSRWCPVTHYSGDSVTKDWVKARGCPINPGSMSAPFLREGASAGHQASQPVGCTTCYQISKITSA